MSERTQIFLQDLSLFGDQIPQAQADALRRTSWLETADIAEIEHLLRELLARPATKADSAELPLIKKVLLGIYQRFHLHRPAAGLPTGLRDCIMALYQRYPSEAVDRHYLLAVLAMGGGDDLSAFADLMAEDPPQNSAAVGIVMGPLFQRSDDSLQALFPRLLDGVVHLSVAAAILDLANHLTRCGRIHPHPGFERRSRLADLLGQLALRLGRLEEKPHSPLSGQNVEDLSQTVTEGVALAVSLCDALALIGDKQHVGKLYQALELRHRRLRTEAAAALAKLGEKAGQQALLELAAQPVARLRVLAYADELHVLDSVEEQYRTSAARAEAELACWLSEPAQYGFPPTRLNLVEQREQYWPGFEEPQECFLIRFRYELGGRPWENIGMAGPLVHAFSADLTHLPEDDLFALFAGWQTEHDEIVEREIQADWEGESAKDKNRIAFLAKRLEETGYQHIQPCLWGGFFGREVLIARAQWGKMDVFAAVDSDELWSVSPGSSANPLTVSLVFCIYKGRKLLEMFNSSNE